VVVVTDALFVIRCGALAPTSAVIVNVATFCPALLLSVASWQVTFSWLAVQGAEAFTDVRPVGSASVTFTPVASLGPLFVTVSV
jgi:hypothetical protein